MLIFLSHIDINGACRLKCQRAVYFLQGLWGTSISISQIFDCYLVTHSGSRIRSIDNCDKEE